MKILVVLAVFCLSHEAQAVQRPYHNRGIRQVRFVAGTQSGNWGVYVDWFGFADTTSAQLNFDTVFQVQVNGAPAWQELVAPARFNPTVSIPVSCPFQGEHLGIDDCINSCVSQSCGEFYLGDVILDLNQCGCFGPLPEIEFASLCMCGFGSAITLGNFPLVEGDGYGQGERMIRSLVRVGTAC